jgi:uncharacterized repeat protein (TIGR03843 family)
VTDLLGGELELVGRITVASNATFLATIGEAQVVYKPVAGEKPLWDFPDGTLARRERAAYLVSEAFGWDVVPVTCLRDGPLGPGMVQLWQEPDPAQDPVDVVPAQAVPAEGWRAVFQGIDDDDRPLTLIHEDSPALRRMAVFDAVVNNADRKGGHVLPMAGGHRYGVDHGVSFHTDPKLRTVCVERSSTWRLIGGFASSPALKMAATESTASHPVASASGACAAGGPPGDAWPPPRTA